MARTQDPNSATSQFYITLNDAHFLDGSYAVFGKVVSGMDAVEQIKVGDKMNKVYITDKSKMDIKHFIESARNGSIDLVEHTHKVIEESKK